MNPNKGGRPKKTISEQRVNRVTVSFTEDEYLKLIKVSKIASIRPAQLLRNMCFCSFRNEQFIVTPVSNDLDNAIIKLVAIKTLLKQTQRLVKMNLNGRKNLAIWLKSLERRIEVTDNILKTLS